MKSRLLVSIGDTVYIKGVKTRVRSNRELGNHKWVCNQRHGKDDEICVRLAQNLMDIGEAKFYG